MILTTDYEFKKLKVSFFYDFVCRLVYLWHFYERSKHYNFTFDSCCLIFVWLFYFLWNIKVQVVKKNGNLYNFFKKYPPPIPLPPLKTKIHPLLRPILPKIKKTTVVSSANNSNNNKTIILLPPPCHYLNRQFLWL